MSDAPKTPSRFFCPPPGVKLSAEDIRVLEEQADKLAKEIFDEAPQKSEDKRIDSAGLVLPVQLDKLSLQLDRIEDRLLGLEAASKRIEAEMVDLRRATERVDDKIDSFVLDVLDLKRRARREAQ